MQIRYCLGKVDRLIVAIGGAECRNEKRNPFSGAERAKMLRAYLKEEGLAGRVRVVTSSSARSYKEALSNMSKLCGNVDAIFFTKDNERLAKMASKAAPIRLIKCRKRTALSATILRSAIAAGKEWKHMTGESVTRLICKFGIERIKALRAK